MNEKFLRNGPIPPSIDIERKGYDQTLYIFPYAELRKLQESFRPTVVGNTSLVQNLTNAECIRAYGGRFTSGKGDVVAVTNDAMTDRNSTVFQVYIDNYDAVVMNWVCQDMPAYTHRSALIPGDSSYPGGIDFCDASKVAQNASNWTLDGHRIEYCLSKVVPDHCKLLFSTYILAIVIIMNAAKTASMIWAFRSQKEATLVTIGDAVASFLDRPEELTKGRCLMAEKDVNAGPLDWRRGDKDASVALPTAMTLNAKNTRRWFIAVGTTKWLIMVALFVLSIITVAILLQFGVRELSNYGLDLSSALSLGFGKLDTRALIDIGLPSTGVTGLISDVLLSNLAQLVCSTIRCSVFLLRFNS